MNMMTKKIIAALTSAVMMYSLASFAAAEDLTTISSESSAQSTQQEYTRKTTQLDEYESFKNWSLSEYGPAQMSTETDSKMISDGIEDHEKEVDCLNITITNPGGKERGGMDRWDCGLFTNTGDISADNYYKVSFYVSSDHSGELYTRIGNKNGDQNAWQNCMGLLEISFKENSGKTTKNYDYLEYYQTQYPIIIDKDIQYKITAYFKSTKNIKDAVWEFQFGGAGDYQIEDSFPEGTVLTFMDMEFSNAEPTEIINSDAYINNIIYDQVKAKKVVAVFNPYSSDYTQKETKLTDKGILSNWYAIEGGPAKLYPSFYKLSKDDMEYTYGSEDGTYRYVNINIDNPGGKSNGGIDRWDCALRSDIGNLKKGSFYCFSYCIRTNKDGEFFSCLSAEDQELLHNNMAITLVEEMNKYSLDEHYKAALDYKTYYESLNNLKIEAFKEYHITVFYHCIDDFSNVKWEFDFGGAGDVQEVDCFPQNTTLTFGELIFEEITVDEASKRIFDYYENEDIKCTDLKFFSKVNDYILNGEFRSQGVTYTRPNALPNQEQQTIKVSYRDTGETVEKTFYTQEKIIGDLNGDGATDLTDLTILSCFLMGAANLDKSLANYLADVDGNGTVDIADLARYKQYICHDESVPVLVKSN